MDREIPILPHKTALYTFRLGSVYTRKREAIKVQIAELQGFHIPTIMK